MTVSQSANTSAGMPVCTLAHADERTGQKQCFRRPIESVAEAQRGKDEPAQYFGQIDANAECS